MIPYRVEISIWALTRLWRILGNPKRVEADRGTFCIKLPALKSVPLVLAVHAALETGSSLLDIAILSVSYEGNAILYLR